MRGKLGMVSVTTGTSADTYAPDGIDGSILDIAYFRPVDETIRRELVAAAAAGELVAMSAAEPIR